MNKPSSVRNEEQARQKPPVSPPRIAGEILAGTATGLAVGYPIVYVIFGTMEGAGFFEGCMGGLAAAAVYLLVCPMAYGLATVVGVYLVGSRGKQTGFLPAALAGGIIGGFVTTLLFPFTGSSHLVGVEKTVLWAVVLLIAPAMATLAFNLTRRYKKPPSGRPAARLMPLLGISLAVLLLLACLIVRTGVLKSPAMRVKAQVNHIESGTATREELIEALKSPDWRIRSAAARKLGEMKENSAVEPLIRCLGEKDNPWVRSVAAQALAMIEDPRAMGPLVEALADENRMVRRWAIVGLRAVGDASCIPVLEELARTDPKNSRSAKMTIEVIRTREGSEQPQ